MSPFVEEKLLGMGNDLALIPAPREWALKARRRGAGNQGGAYFHAVARDGWRQASRTTGL